MPWNGLADYQLDAINRMKNGCILAGGVGSGKSRTALAYYSKENGSDLNSKFFSPMKDDPQDLYIITTAQKRDRLEWENEFPLFRLTDDPLLKRYKHRITVDSWNNIHKYINAEGAFFIFDEQRVIGSGEWVKSFLKITKKNNWILLSATPGDTWSDYVPVFIANGFYKNRTEFKENHIIYSSFTKFPKIDRYIGIQRLIRLRDKILVQMDYTNHTIPHHEAVYVEYDRALYKSITSQRWNPYKNEPIGSPSELGYLWRKVVNSDLSRQSKVLDIFSDHPKVIIFYNFDYELDILRGLPWNLRHAGTEIAEWNGHKHQPIPESSSWVYLVQYTAGCEGWNCIKTDTIIFYSQNYSYKVLIQAAGRIDRLNTPFRDLYYYHLRSKSGIDLAIAQAIREKKNFNENRYINSMKGEKKAE